MLAERGFFGREELWSYARLGSLLQAAPDRPRTPGEKAKPAPALFNLSDLQSYAARRWKFEATKTERLVEGLYLKKYLSYPRTDCRFITEDEFNYLRQYLSSYQNTIHCHFEPVFLEPTQIGRASCRERV